MNKKAFIKLFLKLLEKVLDLKLDQKISDGVMIYASRNNSLRILVLANNKGFKYFIKNIPQDLRQKAKETMRHRACLIGNMPDFMVNDEVFDIQVVLPAKSLNAMCKNVMDLKNNLNIIIPRQTYLEAQCVEYIFHELRHIVQMRGKNVKRLFTGFNNLPSLINGLCSNRKLVAKYRKWAKGQMVIYAKHYTGDKNIKRLLKMEKDAMIIGLLAFDCWLSQNTQRQKISRLKKIIWSQKKRS